MALNMPTFYKRTGSAIVFAIIMLGGLLWNEMAFLALACLINALCLRDYFRLMQKIDKEAWWPAWLPIALQLISFLLMLVFSLGINMSSGWLVSLFALLPIVPTTFILISALSRRQALPALFQAIGGLFYITMPMILFVSMRRSDFVMPIAVLLMIWCNDTMAYLVGSFIGKTPFSPISPKKTWEGTAGGAILTIIGAGVYGYYAQTYPVIDWLVLALIVTVSGTIGDLLESKMKRLAEVKDSGNLMPGHGGALDRFDSLLVAVPFAFIFIAYVMVYFKY